MNVSHGALWNKDLFMYYILLYELKICLLLFSALWTKDLFMYNMALYELKIYLCITKFFLT